MSSPRNPIYPKTGEEFLKQRSDFHNWLVANGSAILAPTTPWEISRFISGNIIAFITKNKSDRLHWMNGADLAWLSYKGDLPWNHGNKPKYQTKRESIIISNLLLRDGNTCAFCNRDLDLQKIAITHFIPLASGGPDEQCNLILAHPSCSLASEHLPIKKKIDLAVELRGKDD